jgi:LysR family cys regulon transcriptional activator
VGDDLAAQDRGNLTIAATHTQARYALPTAVRDFGAQYPNVSLRLKQGSPLQVAQWLIDGEADIGVATETLATRPELIALPCYQWTHAVIVPHAHPLAVDARAHKPLSLAALAAHPVITYEPGFAGRSHIDTAFAQQGLSARVVLEAMDSDVIKTYVELGMGVGIVAAIAMDEQRDARLCVIDARHLFARNITRLGLRRGAFLRGYAYDFIETFAPTLTRRVVESALAAEHGANFDI